MIKKQVLLPEKIRQIERPFGWIPQRFVTEGHIKLCRPEELLIYFFLSIVADRQGLSFYSDKRICDLLQLEPGTLYQCRRLLEEKSYIKYQKPLYQVLSLPGK